MTHSIKKGQYAMNPDYNITLARGNHPVPPDDCGNPQRCLFEWYNWLTRATHTAARPPVLHTFGMRLNDILPDDRRQELVRFLPNGEDRLAGTEHDGKDETRGYIALDWLIRTYTPTWLDLAGLTAEAGALRDLRRISDLAAAPHRGFPIPSRPCSRQEYRPTARRPLPRNVCRGARGPGPAPSGGGDDRPRATHRRRDSAFLLVQLYGVLAGNRND